MTAVEALGGESAPCLAVASVGDGCRWASTRSEASGAAGLGAGVAAALTRTGAGAVAGAVGGVAAFVGWIGASGTGAGAAGAGDTAGDDSWLAGAGAAGLSVLPLGAGKETTRAPWVRSITGTVSRCRSKTTRETGLGAGLNWATCTRPTTALLTARLVRWARLITPSRSMTKRRGSVRAKVE